MPLQLDDLFLTSFPVIMENREQRIKELEQKLQKLVQEHSQFGAEIKLLVHEIQALKSENKETISKPLNPNPKPELKIAETPNQDSDTRPRAEKVKKTPAWQEDLEKFIGENLINKIGILLTIIGVVIGGKYAVDNNMLSPTMRLILGYGTGLVLLGIALKLKKAYRNFSAVLLGGALAILYFMTYAAYTFYQLFPAGLSFALMFLVTAGAVFSALIYNREVIAVFGLTGAYAIPYLVSKEQGSATILFSYISIINLGILFIAFKRYWKLLFYSAFVFSWFIFLAWKELSYEKADLITGLLFSLLFYLSFQASFVAYKIKKQEAFQSSDLIILFSNSLVYFFAGYLLLEVPEGNFSYQGMFTFFIALLNALASLFVYRAKGQDPKLFNVLLGISILFFSISIPIQLDGPALALSWTAEALVLFWLARHRNIHFFEYFSYPLYGLAFVEMLRIWPELYAEMQSARLLFLNVDFFSAILFAAAGMGLYLFHIQKPSTDAERYFISRDGLARIVLAVGLFGIYYSFRWEVVAFFERIREAQAIYVETATGAYYQHNPIYSHLSWLSDSLLPLLFLLIYQVINLRKTKDKQGARILNLLTWLLSPVFLIIGLFNLGELTSDYLNHQAEDPFPNSIWPMLIRYPAFLVVACLLYINRRNTLAFNIKEKAQKAYEIFMHLIILSLLSSEFLHCLKLVDFDSRYRLVFTILVSLYAFFLIWWGMQKSKKHLRITAMVLFSIVILKVLLYDLSELDTISKTIVLVAIGALLLLSSFWYNRQKRKLED